MTWKITTSRDKTNAAIDTECENGGEGWVPDCDGECFISDRHVEWQFDYRLITGKYTFDY